MNASVILILVISALSAAAGQILFKLGSMNAKSAVDFANLNIFFGLVSYGGGMVLWLVALSKAPLSLVYPFTILTFITVGLAGILVFAERPSALTIAGWSVMLCGILIVHLGAR